MERGDRHTREASSSSLWRRWLTLATPDWRPLQKHREFRLFALSQWTSFFGSTITYVAIPFQVYALTRSPLAVGLLGLVELAPLGGFVVLGGVIADSTDRRWVAILTEAGLAATSAALLATSVVRSPSILVLYAVAAVRAGMEGLQRPALTALLPRLVEPDHLTAAATLTTMGSTLGHLLGPAASGLLIASVGLPATYAVDLATFAVSIGLLSAMAAVPPPQGGERPSLRGALEGLAYAARRPELLGTYVVDFVAMLFGMPMALYPAIATAYGGPGALGLMYSAPAVGSFLANATSGWTSRVHRHGLAVILAAGVWGLAVVAFGLSRTLLWSLLFLTLAGAADMLSGVFRMTIWNRTIPDATRGRLASVEILSYSSGPLLGNVESGVAARLFDVRTAVVSGGALCVLGVGAMAACLPGFRRYDERGR